jgi:hypothetical protein
MDIKKYYENYLFESTISIDKLIYNIKINKTFEYFMILCCKYNISLFEKYNNLYYLKSNKQLLIDCKNIRKNTIHKIILFYTNIMNDENSNWIDIKTKIDKVNNDINISLGELDIIYDLLLNIYDDDSLSEQIKLNNNKLIIEEFSNIPK